MKNNYLFIIVANLIFSISFCQENIQIQQLSLDQKINDSESQIAASYYVEECINLKLGAHITNYEFSDSKLINTPALDSNNSKTFTPKHKSLQISGKNNGKVADVIKNNSVIASADKSLKSIEINLIETYERILQKGYRSEKLLKSVSDEHFFNDDLETAAKWYSELIALNTNLEAIYYYRYAKSLVSINELEKSNEMMKIFTTKNL